MFNGSVVCGLFFILSLFSVSGDTEDDEGEEDGANKGSTDSNDFVACQGVGDCFSDG